MDVSLPPPLSYLRYAPSPSPEPLPNRLGTTYGHMLYLPHVLVIGILLTIIFYLVCLITSAFYENLSSPARLGSTLPNSSYLDALSETLRPR